MNYREIELMNKKAIAADATEVIDLDMKEPLSKVSICYESINTDAAATAHPAASITDITLKDGSDILYSLSGYQAQAADFYHTNKETPSVIYWGPDWYHELIYNLNFGRYLWDKELALDPSHFSNLQLSISIDIDAGGRACDAGILSVIASGFDEKKIEPLGFITNKEHKSYTGGSATHERINLPVDNAYRMLMFRCLVSGTGPEYLYDRIKLEQDAGAKIPFDLTGWELIRNVQTLWKPYVEWQMGATGQTSANFFCTPAYWPMLTGSHWMPDEVASYYSFYSGDGGRYAAMSSGTSGNHNVAIRGWCPHGTIAYPFGVQSDLDDWYEMENIGSLIVDILSKTGMSTNTSEVFSQQLRRY